MNDLFAKLFSSAGSDIVSVLIDGSPLAVVGIDTKACVTVWNASAEKLFGWLRAEVIGKPHPFLFGAGAEEFRSSFEDLLHGTRLRGGKVVRWCKNGSAVLTDWQADSIRNSRDEVIGILIIEADCHGCGSDTVLRDTESGFRAVFDNVLDGIIIVDDHRRYVDVNPAACKLIDRSREQLIGMALGSSWRDPSVVRKAWEQAADTDEIVRQELTLVRPDGSSLIVEYSGKRHFVPGRSMILVRDVTEHRQLEQRLRQAQKMEAIGRLAGGVAHDFNNMLTAIRGYAELLLDKLVAGDPLRTYAAGILDAADRSATVTQQLLAFSRRQVVKTEVLDINSVVDDISVLLTRLIGENIQLRLVRQSDLGLVKADSGQIGQILVNLAVNARDAMPNGGKLFVETCNAELDETYCRTHAGAVPGRHVLLSVTDTGCGIEPDQMAHIFEPFFTTKDLGKGTGLGLATVYGIAKQSGGYVMAYSEPGEGSTFKIYLPRVDAEKTVPEESGAGVINRPLTIVIIEDDSQLRQVITDYLTTLGYKVLAAPGGNEALSLMQRHEGDIHLILSDLNMKGTSGLDLTGYIAIRAPHARWLYMSGFSCESSRARGLLQPGAAFLSKPFMLRELALKIEEVLNNSLTPGDLLVPKLEQSNNT